MCAIESSRRHKCIILEQHAITSPHNFSAVCSIEEKKKRNQCKDDGGGGDLLTGQEEQTVCSISLHQLWRNPSNRERRLSTTENIHLPLYRIFTSPLQSAVTECCASPHRTNPPSGLFLQSKTHTVRKNKGIFGGKILLEGSSTLVQ